MQVNDGEIKRMQVDKRTLIKASKKLNIGFDRKLIN